jgi:hypothetical protein
MMPARTIGVSECPFLRKSSLGFDCADSIPLAQRRSCRSLNLEFRVDGRVGECLVYRGEESGLLARPPQPRCACRRTTSCEPGVSPRWSLYQRRPGTLRHQAGPHRIADTDHDNRDDRRRFLGRRSFCEHLIVVVGCGAQRMELLRELVPTAKTIALPDRPMRPCRRVPQGPQRSRLR